MSTLVILAAGKSTRFPGMRPKWLLTHPSGEIVIEKVLNSADISQFKRIIVSFVLSHEREYKVTSILKLLSKKFRKPIEACILNKFTRGPAETAAQTIKKKKIRGQVVFRDCDNIVKFHHLKARNYIVGLDLNENEVSNIKAKSFVILNERNKIVDIIEKKIISNIISVGVYAFRDAEVFLRHYNLLSTKNDSEIFISHIVSLILGLKKDEFEFSLGECFEDYGTLIEWQNVVKRSKTIFCDFDGVLVENVGRYGSKNWDNHCNALKENVEFLKKLVDKNAQLVITTARPESYRSKIIKFCKQHRLNAYAVVLGLNHSERLIINDHAETTSYPSCTAISIQRDDLISKYLR